MPELTKDILTLDTPPSIQPADWLAERSTLAVDSLHATGRLRLRVRGESMLPSLWPGDVVEIASCSIADVRPGEIVLAIRDGRFFLHRFVTRSGSEHFLLHGDSVPAPDPPFPNEALLGSLVARIAGNHFSNDLGNGATPQAAEELSFAEAQPFGVPERFGVAQRLEVPGRLGVAQRLGVPERLGVAQRFSAAIGGLPSTTALAPEVHAPSSPVLPPRPWTRAIGWLLCHIAPARSLALRIHALRREESEISSPPLRPTDLEAS